VIVFDASVLIAYLDAQDAHHARAEALLVREIEDEFGANSLTLAEVLVVPARNGRLDAVVAALTDVQVRELPFPDDVAAKLAQLRAETSLKMPDCCVLLAAEDLGARVATFDDRLRETALDRAVAVVSG
jgi:predicted nucleic acid-binding protein